MSPKLQKMLQTTEVKRNITIWSSGINIIIFILFLLWLKGLTSARFQEKRAKGINEFSCGEKKNRNRGTNLKTEVQYLGSNLNLLANYAGLI